ELPSQSGLGDAGVLVLAGGRGSRLKKSEDVELQVTPKVLVPIDTEAGRVSMLGHTLNRILVEQPGSITLLTSNDPLAKAPDVESFAKHWAADNLYDGLKIIREDQPQGTAGAVRNALEVNPD